MIEFFISLLSLVGFGMGDADDPVASVMDSENQQIIRAIDSLELKGLNTLEAHDADEWFV